MRDAGIPTVVWLSPILPFINDTEGKGDGILDPKGTATRAEVAAMLHRFLEA
jgi:DNA repair photolyase